MTNPIGDLIRIKRLTKRFSQKDLATKSGISFQTISRFEIGDQIPSIKQAVAIAKTLDFCLYEYDFEKGASGVGS